MDCLLAFSEAAAEIASNVADKGAEHSLYSMESLIALATLASLEIVLGIDNIVFISILVGKLPEEKRAFARNLGLFLAMFTRIALLFCISWVMGLVKPLFTIFEHTVTGKDLVLLIGGMFLIGKATFEIHHKTTGHIDGVSPGRKAASSFGLILTQIILLDIVFSLDSVITAVGMVKHIEVMVIAVVMAVLVMLLFAGKISHFIEKYPTLKILALSFLLLIGVMLVAEGCGTHVEKGYIYFAMGFSLFVETLNIVGQTRKLKKAQAEAAQSSDTSAEIEE